MEQIELQKSLDELRQTLVALNIQNIPTETRGALHSIHHKLKSLSESLGIGKADDKGRLDALYRVSQSLGTSLNLDDVLTNVMDSVIELTGAERGFLVLIDSHDRQFKIAAARNFGQKPLDRKEMKVSRTVINSVVETGTGVVTTDAQSDPRFSSHDSVVFYSLRSILCAPLRARGEIIGVIYVDNRAQTGIFTDSDLELLNAFAAHAAIAIDNARLYTQTDQALEARIRELETLSQIDRALNEQLDFQWVMEQIHHWAIEGTGGQYSWILLPDEETGEFRNVTGPTLGTAPLLPVEIAQSLNDPENWTIRHFAAGNLHYLRVPLRSAGATIGGLVIASDDLLNDDAVQFIERYASRAATALQNARLYQAVNQANESKSKFVSIVTHELRIPLTSINGYADLLRMGAAGPVNEKQSEFIHVIRNNVNRMAALISDLADMSRIERGRLSLEVERMSIGPCVAQTVDSLRPKLEEKSQQIEIHIPELTPDAKADSNRVTQVLTNLISNAWKYTPEGGTIYVRASSENSHIRIDVQDTGIGISDEDQERMFTQFFRSEDPAVREVNGWGLGLHVTKKLVEIMEGEIGFSSSLGEGSDFWFTIPIFNGDEKS